MSTLATALIVAVLAPAVLALMTARINSASKKEDWKRQDEVALRVETVSETLKDQGEKTDKQLHSISETVSQVHTMSDGALSLAKEQTLDSYRAQMATLEQIGDIQQAMGREPTLEAKAALKVLHDKISKLQHEVDERAKLITPDVNHD